MAKVKNKLLRERKKKNGNDTKPVRHGTESDNFFMLDSSREDATGEN